MNESQKRKNRFNDIANYAGQTLLNNRTQNWFFTGTVVRAHLERTHATVNGENSSVCVTNTARTELYDNTILFSPSHT